MGEVLHEVDFNQLKIENSQYLEKIDERNQDLLRLKLMAGNTLQVLNTYKVRPVIYLPPADFFFWEESVIRFSIFARSIFCGIHYDKIYS